MALVRFSRRPARLAFQSLTGLPTFEDFENRLQKVMDSAFADNGVAPTPIGWAPAMEITETPTEMLVSAELPGLETKDVDISVDDDLLTISGEKTEEKSTDDRKFHLWERHYGAFQRSFSLPRGVDASKISAQFKNGVLKVHMPKTPEQQAKGRKIEIAAK